MTEPMDDRLPLARIPTPIEPLSRVGEDLEVELLVKRDDLTGLALTGNKVRKLEYLLREATDEGADTLVTCGGIQSNHARATAAVAARLGLACTLVLRDPRLAEPGEPPRDLPREGNLLLDRLFGAEIRTIPPARYPERDAIMEEAARELTARGRSPWVIPEGGSNGRGALGYVRAAAEITDHPRGPFDVVACPVGSGGTLAGLATGLAREGASARVIGYAVCDDAPTFVERVRGIVGEVASLLGEPELADAPFEVDDRYRGPAYAETGPEDRSTIVRAARREGLVLDPVYTAKAFRGLLASVREGSIDPGSRVLFVHTGGIYGLFPRADTLPLVG